MPRIEQCSLESHTVLSPNYLNFIALIYVINSINSFNSAVCFAPIDFITHYLAALNR